MKKILEQIDASWVEFFQEEMQKEYFKNILKKIEEDKKNGFLIFPKDDEIFNVFKIPRNKIKIVILGQDPYYNEKEANGLAFSVNVGIPLPPSLKNIFLEIENELGIKNVSGDLKKWANQGVFLLNTSLSVINKKPNSHKNIGWQIFIDKVIKNIDEINNPIAFLLWGKNATDKKKILTNKNHLILESVHPSPLSAYRGFFNCNHFKKANEFLEKNKMKIIDWSTD